jgi:hypothetical protein
MKGRVAQEAIWQADKLFSKCLVGIKRVTNRISDSKIDCGEPCGVRVSNPGHLDRRRPVSHHIQAVVSCVTCANSAFISHFSICIRLLTIKCSVMIPSHSMKRKGVPG